MRVATGFFREASMSLRTASNSRNFSSTSRNRISLSSSSGSFSSLFSLDLLGATDGVDIFFFVLGFIILTRQTSSLYLQDKRLYFKSIFYTPLVSSANPLASFFAL